MGISHSEAYAAAGVDIEAGYQGVKMMNRYVQRTLTADVISDLGGFGGLFSLDLHGLEKPVLVSGTDGVGTKQRIAQLMDRHNTVGIDCVAMCVNDIICQGAVPLFFLDYIATGKVQAEKIADIVKGIADGCVLSECSLVGGETAEMPSFYGDDEYDMAGFAVGIADKKNIIDGSKVAEGDILIGLPSSGIHSNGYSLVRKIFFDKMDMDVADYVEELGTTLGDALIMPTRIYVKACKALFGKFDIHGIVHMTGGGFYENIPRILPDGLGAEIETGSWEVPEIFKYIKKCGNVDAKEMFSTFNMGIGMILTVDPADAGGVMDTLTAAGEKPSVIGKISSKEGVSIIKDGEIL